MIMMTTALIPPLFEEALFSFQLFFLFFDSVFLTMDNGKVQIGNIPQMSLPVRVRPCITFSLRAAEYYGVKKQ